MATPRFREKNLLISVFENYLITYLRLLRTFAGVLGKKICMRAILKENMAKIIDHWKA